MLALIPARSGSKGIKGKNLAPVGGKPLIAHTILAALGARCITRVVVSTDSPEIRDVALKFGAEVPFLREGPLATDSARAIDVLQDACARLGKPEEVCYLQPTSPLRTSDDIAKAVALFKNQEDAKSVVSLAPAPCPIRWYRRLEENGRVNSFFDGMTIAPNRQEEEELFVPNGAIYIVRTRAAFAAETFTPAPCFGYIMPRERSVDVDYPLDLRIAEMLMTKK